MTSLRIFFVGGRMSYRALFYWLTPQIYVPSLLVAPIFQILLFAYIGRSAGLQSDKFYLVGNALQYAAVPCLFAMSQLIGGERYQNTLSAILVSPAGQTMRQLAVTTGVTPAGVAQIDLPLAGLVPGLYSVEIAAKSPVGAAKETIAFRISN